MNDTLKDLRVHNKKTVAEVAKVLGVTERAVSRYEQGTRTINIQQVLTLATLYDVMEREIIQAQLNSIIGKSN